MLAAACLSGSLPVARADSSQVAIPVASRVGSKSGKELTDGKAGATIEATNLQIFDIKTNRFSKLTNQAMVGRANSFQAVQTPDPDPSFLAQSLDRQIADGLSTPSGRPTLPTADELRQNLQIPPINLDTAQFYHPGSGTGIPEGFGSEWGDVFVTVFGSGTDRVRTTYVDSSISVGFGLGNSRNLVGLELNYNVLSTRTAFALNGSFDVKLNRYIFENDRLVVSGAVGVNNFIVYGPEAAFNVPTLYGVVSGATYLQPDNPNNPMLLTVTLGAGGAPNYATAGTGLIAGAGVEVNPQLGIGSAWNGTGFSLGASYVPFRNIPLTLTALYEDIFDMTEAGHKLVIAVGFSQNLW
ncbi:MAG: hypothetical protein LVS60_08985 [Nodosilinea sp. LVE1205-7]